MTQGGARGGSARRLRRGREDGPRRVRRERGSPAANTRWRILQGRALPSIRIETPRSFYDYEAKYFRDDTKYHCPSGLSAAGRAAPRESRARRRSTPRARKAGAAWIS